MVCIHFKEECGKAACEYNQKAVVLWRPERRKMLKGWARQQDQLGTKDYEKGDERTCQHFSGDVYCEVYVSNK